MYLKFLLLSVFLVSVSGQTCLALALSGGGGRGGYEAGVLFGLANATEGPNIQYEVVSGISIGSVNTGIVTQFPIGQELPMATYLVEIWRAINGSSDVWQEWPGGYIEGLLFQRGLVNNAPAIEYGRSLITGPRTRKLSIGSTNLDLGIFQTFNESVGGAIIDAIISSGSIPAWFPPHEFEGYSWADGGCIDNLDVFSAVERCLQQTQEKNIVVDIIQCDPYPNLPPDTEFKTIDVLQRTYSIRSFDGGAWYAYNAQIAYPSVTYRYYIRPSQDIAPLLNFTKESIAFDIKLGIQDAYNTLKNPVSGKTMIQELYNEVKSKIYYP